LLFFFFLNIFSRRSANSTKSWHYLINRIRNTTTLIIRIIL
jgi:hypothetical protein